MTIETKFNVGDTAFVLAANKVHEVKIIGINAQYSNTFERIEGRGTIKCSMPKQYVTYRVKYQSGGESVFEETDVFATKQDLVNSL
mgnify:CR=1